MWNAVLSQGHWQGELWHRRKSGESHPEILTVDALRATFAVVETVPVSFVNDLVDEEHTDWLFVARDEAIASDA